MPDSNLFSEGLADCHPVWLHPSAGMAARAERKGLGLASGKLHPSLHYASSEQIRLWLEVHRSHAPASFLEFYQDFFQGLAQRLDFPECFHLVALGAATAAKERLLLEAAEAQGRKVVGVLACDIGVDLAVDAANVLRGVSKAETCAVAVAWDAVRWSEFLSDEGAPALATAFGVLPNLLPEDAARCLAGPMRAGDLLVASAHLAPCREGVEAPLAALERIERQYHNAETFAWLERWLVEQGLESAYPRIEMGKAELSGVPAFVFDAQRENGTLEHLPQMLRLFFSLRPTESMVDAWAGECGLECVTKAVHPSREEGLWCWRKPAHERS